MKQVIVDDFKQPEKLKKLKEKYLNTAAQPNLPLKLDMSEITDPNQCYDKDSLQKKYQKLRASSSPTETYDKENKNMKKTGRRSLAMTKSNETANSSPKHVKSKFKECTSQSNLNGFLKLKPKVCDTPVVTVVEDLKVNDEAIDVLEEETQPKSADNLCINEVFKISSNIFMSPKCNKKRLKNLKKKSKNQSAEESETSEKIEEIKNLQENLTNQDNLVDHKKETECSNYILQNDQNLAAFEPVITINELENPHSDILLNTSIINLESDHDCTQKIINEVHKESNEASKLDAMTMLMNNRTKVIGSNSPGRLKSPEEPVSADDAGKLKLKARRAILANFAANLGKTKRKLDEERDEQIKNILQSRAKRLKEMLNIGADDSEDINSPGISKNAMIHEKVTQEELAVENNEENETDDNRNLEKKDNMDSVNESNEQVTVNEPVNEKKVAPKIQKGLLSFYNVMNKDENCAEVNKSQRKSKLSLKKSTTEILNETVDSFALTQELKSSLNKVEDLSGNSSSSSGKKRGRPLGSKKGLSKSKTSRNEEANERKTDINKKCVATNEKPIETNKKVPETNKISEETNKKSDEANEKLESKSDLEDKDDLTKNEENLLEKDPKLAKTFHSKFEVNFDEKLVNTEETLECKRVNSPNEDGLTNEEEDSSKKPISPRENAKETGLRRSVRLIPPKTYAEDPETEKTVKKSKTEKGDKTEKKKKVLKVQKGDATNTPDSHKSKKVAPVFTKAAPKPKIEPAVLAARSEFLRSGVPNQLKRVFEKVPSVDLPLDVDIFPKTSHVQQKCASKLWNLPKVHLKLAKEHPETKHSVENSSLQLGTLTNSNASAIDSCMQIILKPVQPFPEDKLRDFLTAIKEENSKYPVYKCFRNLRECNGIIYKPINNVETPKEEVTSTEDNRKSKKHKKKSKKRRSNSEKLQNSDENFDQLLPDSKQTEKFNPFSMWTEKYKSKLSSLIIGNQKSVQKLQSWLESWLKFSKEMQQMNEHPRKRKRQDSASDFESDDSRDSAKVPPNTLILRGPSGSGKTNAVYAACNELGINVLELNASSRRTGKRLLQELQEATQSHQVRRNNNPFMNFVQEKRKKEKSNHELEKKPTENKMCLLLVEDADIVFDQDDGFVSALNQLIVTSKRPIVLTANDVTCQHMQKFLLQHPILNFSALSALSMATYLQILCLVEGLHVDKNSLGQLIEWNKGDVRRTLLQLQFWVQSGGDSVNIADDLEMSRLRSKQYRLDALEERYHDDEEDFFQSQVAFNSQLNVEIHDDENAAAAVDCRKHEFCLSSFVELSAGDFTFPTPVNLGTVWWNVTEMFASNLQSKGKEDQNDKMDNLGELESLFYLSDSLSFSDFISASEGLDFGLEPTPKYFEEGLKDSLSLQQSEWRYKSDNGLVQELIEIVVKNGFKRFNECLNVEDGAFNMAVPASESRRWRAKQNDCESLFQDAMTNGVVLDRKSFSTDYYAYLRQIARAELKRSKGNAKRGNRFYNYLQSLNVDAGNKALLKTACHILQ